VFGSLQVLPVRAVTCCQGACLFGLSPFHLQLPCCSMRHSHSSSSLSRIITHHSDDQTRCIRRCVASTAAGYQLPSRYLHSVQQPLEPSAERVESSSMAPQRPTSRSILTRDYVIAGPNTKVVKKDHKLQHGSRSKLTYRNGLLNPSIPVRSKSMKM
jgi:hypothetical protein